MEISKEVATAFPMLDPAEIDLIRRSATVYQPRDGEAIWSAGQSDVDFFVVESGGIEVVNPTSNNRTVAMHGAGEFTGDIDLLTRRPVVVTAYARGETRLLRVPGGKLRYLLNTVPRLGEKLLSAFQIRRDMLEEAGSVGLQVIGDPACAATNQVREFLFKNFVPFEWTEPDTDAGRAALRACEIDEPFDPEAVLPVIRCGDGSVLKQPSLRQLARCAGIRVKCPSETFDFAIVGAGPAGLAAGVYAASEGLSTVVLDRLGPGGQAGGSSKIENFIGFPSGLSGAELAERGVLQLLKFGATVIAPADVKSVARQDDGVFRLEVDDADHIKARCVLAATGAAYKRLEARGAERFERAGIYYACTAVEARLCGDSEVIVVGGGNSAGQAAMFMSDNARRVHLVVRGDDFAKGMSDYLASRIRACDRIEVHTEAEVVEVEGDDAMRQAIVACRKTGQRHCVPAAAIFVFIGAEPHSRWLPGEVARDASGYVLTGPDVLRSGKWTLDREPMPLETSVPGILVGGDLRSGGTKRVGFAVGDGSMAVTCVHRWRAMA